MIIFLCKKYKLYYKIIFLCYTISGVKDIILYYSFLILSSSVVERSTVNRLVVGSSPTWGVSKYICYESCLCYRI